MCDQKFDGNNELENNIQTKKTKLKLIVQLIYPATLHGKVLKSPRKNNKFVTKT